MDAVTQAVTMVAPNAGHVPPSVGIDHPRGRQARFCRFPVLVLVSREFPGHDSDHKKAAPVEDGTRLYKALALIPGSTLAIGSQIAGAIRDLKLLDSPPSAFLDCQC